jgi:caa(3)-type oxidase subunit IV
MDSSHETHPAHDAHDHPFDFSKAIRTYLKVGATLIVFTFITVFVAYKVDLGDIHLNIALGLLIAAFKVSLVALIFMHLNHERGLIYKTLLFTMIFFAAMMFLFCLAYSDPIHNSFLQP